MGFEFAADLTEGLGGEGDALLLHVDEDGHEGGLDFVEDTGESVGLDLWLEVLPKLQGDIGVFDGVVGEGLGVDAGVVDVAVFFLPGDEVVETDGGVAESVLGEAVEVVPLGGVEEGMGEEGIEAGAVDGAVVLGEYGEVKFEVVTDFAEFGVG